MKTFLSIVALVISLSSPVLASGLSFTPNNTYVVVPNEQHNALSYVGYGEYSVETEEVLAGIGVRYNVDYWTLGADALIGGPANNIEFTGVNLGVGYQFTNNFNGYMVVSFDDELEYDNVVLGAQVRF